MNASQARQWIVLKTGLSAKKLRAPNTIWNSEKTKFSLGCWPKLHFGYHSSSAITAWNLNSFVVSRSPLKDINRVLWNLPSRNLSDMHFDKLFSTDSYWYFRTWAYYLEAKFDRVAHKFWPQANRSWYQLDFRSGDLVKWYSGTKTNRVEMIRHWWTAVGSLL